MRSGKTLSIRAASIDIRELPLVAARQRKTHLTPGREPREILEVLWARIPVGHDCGHLRWSIRVASFCCGCSTGGAQQLGKFVGGKRFLKVVALSLRTILGLQG